jgi:hypothetical protein
LAVALRQAAISSTKEVAIMQTDPQSKAPEEETDADPGIVRWIPYVPLSAGIILFSTYLIYALILT